jgi:hypothetical protein
MKTIVEWANQNPVLITIIIAIVGCIGWIIKFLHDKSKITSQIFSNTKQLSQTSRSNCTNVQGNNTKIEGNTVKNQNVENASTNYQIEKQVVVNINASGDLSASVQEISKQLLSSAFGELPAETKRQIENNQQSYLDVLSGKLKDVKNTADETKSIISSPDFQYTAKKASVSASKSSSKELHGILASLLISRASYDSEELKRIVYNESISTAEKLTKDELNIITACYLLRYTKYIRLIDENSFWNYLKKNIKPFLDFKNTNARFQHVEYAGCGSISDFPWGLYEAFRVQYSFYFSKTFETKLIEDLNLSFDIREKIRTKIENDGKCRLMYANSGILKKDLQTAGVADAEIQKIETLYNNNISSAEEIKQQLAAKCEVGKQLVDVYENTQLKYLALTSVGIAIAASYYEQVTGEKINIDIWIN